MNLLEKFRDSFAKKGEVLDDAELETIIHEVKVHRNMVAGDSSLTPEKPAVKQEVSELEQRIAKLEDSERKRGTYGTSQEPVGAGATPRQKTSGSYGR